jgi:hypothetical protein
MAHAQTMQDQMTAAAPWTDEQKQSLTLWTTGAYHDIRALLMRPDSTDPYLGSGNGGPAAIKRHIRNISDSMRPLPETVTVFRKVDLDAIGLPKGARARSLVGTKKQNANFTAASVEPGLAFMGERRGVEMELQVPAGVNASYIDSLSTMHGEGELLLEAGLVIEFTDVRRQGRKMLVKARVVPS